MSPALPSGQSLIQELKAATSWPVIPIKADRDKESRASAVTGYFESGRVLFPEGAAWLEDLEDELASFPGGLHDDCVDAITQALNRLRDNRDELGLITLFKSGGAQRWLDKVLRADKEQVAASSIPALPPVPPQASSKPKVDEVPPCPHCGSPSTSRKPGGTPDKPFVIHCNQCSADDGFLPPTPLGDVCWVEGCGLKLQWSGGVRRCQNHGQVPVSEPQAIQMSFAQYKRRHRRYG
jgi:hypothetical protein